VKLPTYWRNNDIFCDYLSKKTILMTNDDKTEEKNSLHLRSFIKSAIFARPYQKIINLNKI